MMNAATIRELDHLMDDRGSPKLSADAARRRDPQRHHQARAGGAGRRRVDQGAVPRRGASVRRRPHHRASAFAHSTTYDAVDTAIPSADTIIEVATRRDHHRTSRPGHAASRADAAGVPALGVIRRAYELAERRPGFAATDDCGVVFTYLPEVPIKVIARHGREHEGHRARSTSTSPTRSSSSSRAVTSGWSTPHRPTLTGRSVVVFGGSYGIGASIARQAAPPAPACTRFSRSETGTDVTSPRRRSGAALKRRRSTRPYRPRRGDGRGARRSPSSCAPKTLLRARSRRTCSPRR